MKQDNIQKEHNLLSPHWEQAEEEDAQEAPLGLFK